MMDETARGKVQPAALNRGRIRYVGPGPRTRKVSKMNTSAQIEISPRDTLRAGMPNIRPAPVSPL